MRDSNKEHFALSYLPILRTQTTKISELPYTDIVYTINVDANQSLTISIILLIYLNWMNNNKSSQNTTEYQYSIFSFERKDYKNEEIITVCSLH